MTPQDQIPSFDEWKKSRKSTPTSVPSFEQFKASRSTRPRNKAAAEAEVARVKTELDQAADAYMSATGRKLNPPVTERPDYFRPLTTTEKAAKKRGEPVIISEAGAQITPTAPETPSRPRRVTEPPVSLAPVVQGRLDQIKREKRQQETQQKVAKARAIREQQQQRSGRAPTSRGMSQRDFLIEMARAEWNTQNARAAQNADPELARNLLMEPAKAAPADVVRWARNQATFANKALSREAFTRMGTETRGGFRLTPQPDENWRNLKKRAQEYGLNAEQIRREVSNRLQLKKGPETYSAQSPEGITQYRTRLSKVSSLDIDNATQRAVEEQIAEKERQQRVGQKWGELGAFVLTGGRAGSPEYLGQAPKSVVTGFTDAAATGLKSIAVLAKTIDDLTGLDTYRQEGFRDREGNPVTKGREMETTELGTYQLGQIIQDLPRDRNLLGSFASNPDLEQELLVGQSPQAVGQVLAFMLGGWATKAPKVATVLLGAGMTAGDAYDEVRAAGGTDEDAVNAALLAGGLLGPTELIGMRGAMQAITDRTIKETWRAALREALREGSRDMVENALQEMGQEIGQGIITGQIRSPEQVLSAGIQGAVGSTVTVPMTAIANRPSNIVSDYLKASPLSTPEERAASSTEPSVDIKPDTAQPVSKEAVSSTVEPKVAASPGIQENITEIITRPEQVSVPDQKPEGRTVSVPTTKPTVETPAEVQTQPSAMEPVPPPTSDVVRLYRADAPDAPVASGKNWANSVDYVSQKYGAGQMGGEESIWYIDVPKAQLDEGYGDWRAVSGTTTDALKANGIEIEPKLYRRINKTSPSVTPAPVLTKTAATESQLTTPKEATDVTQEAEGERSKPLTGRVIWNRTFNKYRLQGLSQAEARAKTVEELNLKMPEDLTSRLKAMRGKTDEFGRAFNVDEILTNFEEGRSSLKETRDWLETIEEYATRPKVTDEVGAEELGRVTEPSPEIATALREEKQATPKLEEPPAQPVSAKTAAKEPLQLNKQLSDWGGQLKSIAQSKDLNALQVLSDEMASHKDDPRVARLRTAIQDELARVTESEPQFAREGNEDAQLQQAFTDWRERRAYIDGNGNYHVKAEGGTSGPIAPWNKAVKKAFKSVSEFHKAANEQPRMFAKGSEVKPSPKAVQITRKGNRVILENQAAVDALNTAYKEMGEDDSGKLRGAFEKRPIALANQLEDLGYNQMASVVREAAKDGNGKVLLATPKTERHEAFHESSSAANRYLEDRHAHPKRLTATVQWDVMKTQLERMGYVGETDAVLIEEAAAHIAEGQYEQLGLTREEAVDWMTMWFDSFIAKNGTPTPKQFQELAEDAAKARDKAYAEAAQRQPLSDEALPSLQERREGGDRESVAAAREPRDITESEAFKRWFGSSEIVDENGNPQVVYHFTTKEAEQGILATGFDPSPNRARARRSDEGVPDGIFFTPQAESVFSDQMEFARLAVYLKMEKPLRVATREELINWTRQRSPEYAKLQDSLAKYTPDVYKQVYDRFHGEDDAVKSAAALELADIVTRATSARKLMTAQLKREGHDGVIMERDTGGPQVVTTMIVLEPTQIKSATGNRGTFDPNDPNILMARSGEEVYQGEHAPADAESGAPLHDLTANAIYPDDVYGPNGLRYYPTGYEALDREAYSLLQSYRDHPGRVITIYRAVPRDVKGGINAGDWVTPIRRYAVEHGKDNLGGDFKIQKKMVTAKDIFTDGNSWLEWGYDPQPFSAQSEKDARERRRKRASGESSLFARSGDPWSNLSDLAAEFEKIANEPELAPGEKQTKQSKLAKGVEAKAIEAKLTAGFQGLPEYETVKVADQARMAADLLRNDPEQAKQVALGQTVPSDSKLLPESVFVAVENDALQRGDVDLLRELATSSSLSAEATGMGQRLRLLAERNPYSPVTAIKEIQTAREKRAKQKMGAKAKEKVITEIKTEVRKAAPKAKDWKGFLAEIRCK